MPVTSSYGTPGTATYSHDLGGLDQMMSVLPDNTINQITARNVRDSAFTMYNLIQGAIAANLSQVTAVGNTTSLAIAIGGLQVSGTSSFSNNLSILSTLSDINGATGANGYIISATNGGIIWTPNTAGISATPSLQQVLSAGNTTSNSMYVYGNFVAGGTSSTFQTPIILQSFIQDINSKTGPNGYILSATNTGVIWIPNAGSGVGNLYQTTMTGNTTSTSIIIAATNSPYSILLSATMGYIMAFTGAIGPTATYGALRYNGLTYRDSSSSYNINLPQIGNQTITLPSITGTVAVMSNITLDNALLTGGTSSRYASVGGFSVLGTSSYGTASFSGIVSLSSNLNVTGTSSFGGVFINNNLVVGSTASFAGTVSFANGILDNYNNPPSPNHVLGFNAANRIIWTPLNTTIGYTTITSTNSYTLNTANKFTMLLVTSSTTTTLIVPSATFSNGDYLIITQYGTGGVTLTPASGVTINSKSGYLSISDRYVSVTLTRITGVNWLLTGDLIP